MTGRAGPSRLPAAADAEPLVEVRRSARRRRTVSAYRDGDRTVVLIPARMSRAEERRWVAAMLERLDRQDRKLRPGDEALLERAVALSRRYLEGAPVPASVRWVGNQGSRWGSCTPVDRTIRLSDRLQGMPGWVLDYVIVHELVHLRVPGHGADFWAEVEQFPRTERARGYLEGVSATAGLGFSDADESTAVESTAVESTAVESTAVESTAVESTAVESTAVESTAVESTAVESTAVESTAVESTADESTAPTIGENVEVIAPNSGVGRGKRRATTRRGRGKGPSNSRQRPEQGALDFDVFDVGDVGNIDEVDAGDRG